MNTNEHFTLNTGFESYINEVEGYGLRSERLNDISNTDQVLQWLKAAYAQGAKDTADDTLNVLAEYATACAGVGESSYSLSDCFDKAAVNLTAYYKHLHKDVT